MVNLLKNTQEVTIFRDKESGLYSFGDGIRKIEDINQNQFEFVYRFIGHHIKARVDKLLETPIEDSNVQTGLRALFNHRNI